MVPVAQWQSASLWIKSSGQFHMVGVAQLAEHMPVEHEVAGSFPVAHPTT
jgi:hypothetical protein